MSTRGNWPDINASKDVLTFLRSSGWTWDSSRKVCAVRHFSDQPPQFGVPVDFTSFLNDADAHQGIFDDVVEAFFAFGQGGRGQFAFGDFADAFGNGIQKVAFFTGEGAFIQRRDVLPGNRRSAFLGFPREL